MFRNGRRLCAHVQVSNLLQITTAKECKKSELFFTYIFCIRKDNVAWHWTFWTLRYIIFLDTNLTSISQILRKDALPTQPSHSCWKWKQIELPWHPFIFELHLLYAQTKLPWLLIVSRSHPSKLKKNAEWWISSCPLLSVQWRALTWWGGEL
jgi:hypothetical protein